MLLEELQERYELGSKKAIYDRLKALDIKLPKKNRKSYAPPETVEQLDRLQEHLDSGGTLSNFSEGAVTSYEVIESESALDVIESNDTSLSRNDTSHEVIYIEREQDPLAPNRLLTEAAREEYVLTSKQVRQIIGINPRGSSFKRHGFTISRVGRDGAYSSWIVKK